MGKVTDQAFVTLATNDVYCLGALVLANSLRLVNTTRELVVIITPMVTQEMRNHLNSVYDVVVCVDVLESNDQANLALSRRPELGVTFTKINCWKLTQYKKCVFLDSDCLVIKNCDELFDREELSAVPDIGWPDCFNSGVFVFVPSLETYQKLLDLAVQQGSFDGGDQGLLNTFFSSWATKDIAKHLSFIYNMASSATYTYLPAYKRFMKDVKIIHYLGAIKPWNFTCDYSTGRVSVGGLDCYRANHIQTWWDVYMKHVHALLDTRHFRFRPNIYETVKPYWTVVAQYQNIIAQGLPCQDGASHRPYIHKPLSFERGQILRDHKFSHKLGLNYIVPHLQPSKTLLTPPPSPSYGPMLIDGYTSDETTPDFILELSNRGDELCPLEEASLLTTASEEIGLKRRKSYKHDLHLASFTLSPLFYPDLGSVHYHDHYEEPNNKRHHHHHSKRHKPTASPRVVDLSKSGRSVLEKGALSFVETLKDEVIEPRRRRLTTSGSENDSGIEARREIPCTTITDPFNPNVPHQHYEIVTSYVRARKSTAPSRKRRKLKRPDRDKGELLAFDTRTEKKSLLGTPPASLSSGSRSDPPPRLMSDKEHKDAWEGGHIDYMGTDAFENIQRHIESQVQSTNMNTFLASWNSGGEKEVKIKSGNGEGWEGGQSSALFPGSYNKGFEFGAAQSSYVNTNPPNPNPIPIISPTPGYISLTFPPKSGKERKKSAIKKIQQTLPQTVPHELDHPKCETVSTQLDSATSEFFIGDSSSDYGELNHHVTFSPTLTLFDRSADEGYITPRSVIVSTFVPMIQETPEIQHHPSQIPIMISNLGAELNGANNGNLNHEQSEQQNLPLQPDHNLGLKVDNYERDDLSSSEKQARSLKDPKQGIDVTRDIEVFAKTLQNTITGDVLKEKDGMAQAAEAKSVKATAALNDIQPYANTHTSEHFSNALNPIVDYDPEYLSSFVPKKENKSNMHETELPQTIIPLSPSISKIVKRQIKPLNFDPNFTFEGLDESQSKQSVIPIDEEAKGDMEMSASLRSMQSPSKSNETSQLTFTIDESSGKALESLKELDTFSDDRLVIPPLPDKAIIEVTTVKLRCEAGQLGDGDKQTELVEVQLKPQPLTPLSLDSSRLMQHKFSKDNYTQDLKVRNSNSITTYIPRTEIERRIEARNKTRHREILDTNSLNTITTRVPHPQASEALHAVSFSVTIKDRGGREVTKKSYEIGGGSWRDRTHKSPMALDKTARTFERSPSPVTSVASAAIADDELSWSLQDGLSSQPEARSVHSFSSNTSTNSFINPYASSESFVILERGKSSAGFELPPETRTQEADAIKAPPNQTHVINSVRLNKVIEDINLLPPPQYSLPLSPPQTPDPVEDFHRPTPMNIVTYLPDNLKDLNYSSQLNFKPEANERAGIEISSRLIPTTVSPPPEPLKTKPEKGGKTLAQPTSETNTGIGYQSYIKDTLGKLFR